MHQNAARLKLLAACLYELLLLIALLMLCTWTFVAIFGDARLGNKRYFLQLFLWVITGAYFVWCWHKSGQTLATKTWKLKLVNAQNKKLCVKQCCIRYALSSACLLACGLGYLWIFIDRNALFLHDRILKTRFIQL